MANSDEIRSQVLKDRALDSLAKAYSVSVQLCKCSLVGYQPQVFHKPPHISYTPAFRKGAYIHIKEEYNEDWWIGRIVGHESQMVFIPREDKLRRISSESSKIDQTTVYEDAPIMQPIVFLGPSIKNSKLSQFLQTPLITFMREKFADRLVTVSDERIHSSDELKTVDGLEAKVYQAGRSLNLVHLDCPANFPDDFNPLSTLHPLFICIQVSRQTVLHKLVQQITTSSRERSLLLDGANHLSKYSNCCALVISESNLDDACQRLELFLEGYWASTRSILLA